MIAIIIVSISMTIIINVLWFMHVSKKPKIYTAGIKLRNIIRKCPTIDSVYYPFVFGWSCHVQIIIFAVRGYFQSKTRWASEYCILDDGEEVILDWGISSFPNAESGLENSMNSTPILFINPGALGHSKTLLGKWVQKAHNKGWIVCCNNRRGHNKQLTRPKWNFFGSVKDIQSITKNFILKRRPNAKLLMLGLSAGSGLTSRFFCEEHSQYLAGVGVCAAFGIDRSLGRVQQPYQSLLLTSMKNFLKRNKQLLQHIQGYITCIESDNMQTFLDNAYTMAGYTTKEKYYEEECTMRKINKISNPFLFLNSKDDPICTYQSTLDWLPTIESLENVVLLVTEIGSHCAFLEGNLFGIDSYSEKIVFEFFESVLHNNTEDSKKIH